MVAARQALTRDVERRRGRRPARARRRARRSSGWRRSSGRTAARSSTTRTRRPASRSTPPRRAAGACSSSSTCGGCTASCPPRRRSRPRTTRRGSTNGRLAMVLSLAARRRRPSARSPTSSGTSRRCRVTASRPGSCTRDAYCMAKASDDKDAAWQFVEFALGPEGQRIAAATGRTVPSLKASRSRDAFLDPTRAAARARRCSSTRSRRSAACRPSRPGPRSRTRRARILETGVLSSGGPPRRSRAARRGDAPIFARRATEVGPGRALASTASRSATATSSALRGSTSRSRTGELLVVVGPSGSRQDDRAARGAGLESATRASVSHRRPGRHRAATRPERDVSMVFQSYALFPHLTVARQHRLRPRGAARRAAPRLAAASPGRVRAGGLRGAARPAAAGALGRRAAAGRARPRARARARRVPARRAAVEPRRPAARETRAELQRAARSGSARTMVYVTHDQIEALTLGDRVAVLDEGRPAAGRHAGRGLLAAREPLRGALRRHARR